MPFWQAHAGLGGSYMELPISGKAGTCIIIDSSLFHTRLDGNGIEGRRLMHHCFARGKETLLLRHLYIQCIILPRQARDKHRESSKKEWRFLRWLATHRIGRLARADAAQQPPQPLPAAPRGARRSDGAAFVLPVVAVNVRVCGEQFRPGVPIQRGAAHVQGLTGSSVEAL